MPGTRLALEGGRRYYSEHLSLRDDGEGLLLMVADGGGSGLIELTDGQAHQLEIALYKYRINKTFTLRKELDADGEPRTGTQLQGWAPAPPSP